MLLLGKATSSLNSIIIIVEFSVLSSIKEPSKRLQFANYCCFLNCLSLFFSNSDETLERELKSWDFSQDLGHVDSAMLQLFLANFVWKPPKTHIKLCFKVNFQFSNFQIKKEGIMAILNRIVKIARKSSLICSPLCLFSFRNKQKWSQIMLCKSCELLFLSYSHQLFGKVRGLLGG